MKRVILPFPPAGFKPAALALLLVLGAQAARADVQIDKGGKHKLSILLDARVGVSTATGAWACCAWGAKTATPTAWAKKRA